MNRSAGKWLAGGAAAVVLAGVAVFVLLNQDGTPGASLAPSASPTASPTLNAELLNQRLTVLLIGLDSNEPRRARGAGCAGRRCGPRRLSSL